VHRDRLAAGAAEVGGNALGLLRIDVRDHEAHAGSGAGLRDALADATSAARNNRYPTLELLQFPPLRFV
jgi:hypothetical protein